MSQDTLDILSAFSGICSIAALFLYFVTVPKRQKSFSLLLTSIFIGIPLILFLVKYNFWVFAIAILAYSVSIILFSYLYGKTKAEQKTLLDDLTLISNKRPNVAEWITENILNEKTNVINLDAFGVKLDALYKILKGSTYKSKLPQEVEIQMRALILEPNSYGVLSRSAIEKNNRVIKDVELMNEVWAELAKDYKRHLTHSLKIRMYEFTPAFYIIRLNNKMLVGTYLAESGYENLTFYFEKNTGKTFYQFTRFFDRIWDDYSKGIVPTKTPKVS